MARNLTFRILHSHPVKQERHRCNRVRDLGTPMPLAGIPPWTDQDMLLYHGTLDIHVASILAGIDLRVCKPFQDFGRGFYTTTNRTIAEDWANKLALTSPGAPAVIEFHVSRDDSAHLDYLVFVRGDPDAIDYWSFVQYCRTVARDHNRTRSPWYDVVIGPITGTWKSQTVIKASDQFSFHTAAAVAVLDNSQKRQVL